MVGRWWFVVMMVVVGSQDSVRVPSDPTLKVR